jgi:HK97 gp10 family phage protein
MIKTAITYDKNYIKKQVEKEIGAKLTPLSNSIVLDLKEATPKDTGEAANSWVVTNLDKNKLSFEIENNKDYIKYLNAGSSQQAPANFIERTVLDYGSPKGLIVEYKE